MRKKKIIFVLSIIAALVSSTFGVPSDYLAMNKKIIYLLQDSGRFSDWDDNEVSIVLSSTHEHALQLPHIRNFEYIQQQADSIGLIVSNVTKEATALSEFPNNAGRMSKQYFEILNTLQNSMKLTYDASDGREQIKYMLPFIQAQTSYNFAKANMFVLFSLQPTQSLSDAGRVQFWESANFMYENIEIQRISRSWAIDPLETRAVIERLLNVSDHLELLAISENEEEVAQVSKKVLEKSYALRGEFSTDTRNLRNELKMIEENNPAYWFNKAAEMETAHQKINCYTQAILLDRSIAPAYINRSNLYQETGDYDAAINDLRTAIKLDSKNAYVYFNLANILFEQGYYGQAIENFNSTITLHPTYAPAYLNRGNAYRKIRDYQRAINDYSKALELNSGLLLAYTNRGVCYNYSGLYSNAVEDFRKAIELKPSDGAYYNLGCAYWGLQDWEAAIEAWEECLALNRLHKNARNWLHKAEKQILKQKIQ